MGEDAEPKAPVDVKEAPAPVMIADALFVNFVALPFPLVGENDAALAASAPAPRCSVFSSADSLSRSTRTSALRYSPRFASEAATAPDS